jgi:rhamnose transport system substrate-binding protein
MKFTRLSVGVIGAVALLGAACGSDNNSSASTGNTGAPTTESTATSAGTATSGGGGGGAFSSVFLPKCTGNAVFDQANDGAKEAATELSVANADFVGPASCADSTGQLEFVTNAVTQGVNAIMISNNAGDQIDPAIKAAKDAGITVVAWDSPIPSGEGEDLFVAQVDFDETGTVMADMAVEILGDAGGELAILSATPDAANQNAWIKSFNEVLKDPKYANLKVVDTVYGNDDADESYNQALSLIDKHPDLKLIMAPTTVGIAAASKAMQDEGLCEKVKVSGLGLPAEMQAYTQSGCAPEFALWSFKDLGYLAFYAAHAISTGALKAEEGAKFTAGRMGDYTIEKDPTRSKGLRIVMGPFTKYDKTNVAG